MAYDTKVMLTLLAQAIAKSKSIEEAYMVVVRAANVEGVQLPPLSEMMAEINKTEQGQL